jgi:hypothetical protein
VKKTDLKSFEAISSESMIQGTSLSCDPAFPMSLLSNTSGGGGRNTKSLSGEFDKRREFTGCMRTIEGLEQKDYLNHHST